MRSALPASIDPAEQMAEVIESLQLDTGDERDVLMALRSEGFQPATIAAHVETAIDLVRGRKVRRVIRDGLGVLLFLGVIAAWCVALGGQPAHAAGFGDDPLPLRIFDADDMMTSWLFGIVMGTLITLAVERIAMAIFPRERDL